MIPQHSVKVNLNEDNSIIPPSFVRLRFLQK